jgi:hypothetical protein
MAAWDFLGLNPESHAVMRLDPLAEGAGEPAPIFESKT